MSKPRKTIAVDFDGVLHEYTSPWVSPEHIPDEPVEYAIEWLNEMVKTFTVVIHTTRGQSDEGVAAVRAWLREHGYTGPDLLVTDVKVPALLYIDDRGWRFTGPSTFPTAAQVHRAVPWNKAHSGARQGEA